MTTEQRPPPREPWWHDGPAIQPPPPPPGLGPRVGSHTEGRWARWRLFGKLLLTLVVIWAVWGALHRWQPDRSTLTAGTVTLLGTWLLIVWASRPTSVAVGEDWLRIRTTRRDRWVRTDQLVKLDIWFNWANRRAVLQDRDGRRLTVDLDDLNPVMLETFRAAVRRSQAHGLRLGRAAATTLGLDRGAGPGAQPGG
jgi:hypothetical protein